MLKYLRVKFGFKILLCFAALMLKWIKRLTYLLRWDIKVLHPQVDLFVNVHAWNDKEHPGTTGTFEWCTFVWYFISFYNLQICCTWKPTMMSSFITLEWHQNVYLKKYYSRVFKYVIQGNTLWNDAWNDKEYLKTTNTANFCLILFPWSSNQSTKKQVKFTVISST